MSQEFLNFKRYLRIDARTTEIVGYLNPLLSGNLDRIVKRFYERMRQHDEAMARFPGGEKQIGRQGKALRAWLLDLFANGASLESSGAQIRIGAVHLSAAVNEELMIASMNWLRIDIASVLREMDLPAEVGLYESIDAINKLLDFNLGLILTSYWRVLQARVMNADRLILIGQYTAAINHELRNPLGVIGTSAYLLRQEIGETASENTTKHLNKIDRSLERANSIIAGLMRLLRVEKPKRDRIKLDQFLAEQEDHLLIPSTIIAEFRAPAQQGLVAMFDATQMGQVVENLVRNAIDAMEGKGNLLVALTNGPSAVELSVRDSGPGIPPETINQIFDPLFSTKSFGTGLGLTLAKAIVESHSGSFRIVEGLDGKGVGFTIRIPHYLEPNKTDD